MDTRNADTERLLKAFIPSRSELILLPAVSLFLLALLHFPRLFRTIDDKSDGQLGIYIQAKTRAGLSWLDGLVGATVPLMLFWAFIGVIAYILLWAGVSAYHASRNDLPLEKMVAPRGYSYSKLIRDSIARFCLRVVATVMLAAWVYLLFAETLTLVSDLFLKDMSPVTLRGVGNSLLAVLLLSGWLFIVALLSRCIVLRDRVFE